jgi:hypothetical protein
LGVAADAGQIAHGWWKSKPGRGTFLVMVSPLRRYRQETLRER